MQSENEILRTSHKYVQSWSPSPFGFLSKRDKNEMCISCKNEDTDVIVDEVALQPYREFYKDRDFKVMSCSACGAVFSYYKT